MRVSALAGTNLEALRGMIAEHLREARGGASHLRFIKANQLIS